MADYKVEGPELKKLMAIAKRQPLPFAFNPGKTDEEHYLGMHRKHDVGKVAKSVRKEGPTKKVAYGTCKVEGSVLWLNCDVPLPGIAKKLKRMLKNNKVGLAVKVAAADGTVLEDDGEPVPGEADGAAPDGAGAAPDGAQAPQDVEAGPTDGAAPGPTKDEASDRLAEIQEQLRDMPGDAARTLLGEVESALSTIAYQSEEAVQALLLRLEEAFETTEQEADGATDQEAEERAALQARAEALLSTLRGIGGTAAERLITQVEYIVTKLASATLDGLGEALTKVEAAVRALVPDDAQQQAPDAPETADRPAADPEADEAAALMRRLEAARDGIARLTGAAVDRLTRQADYLAERLEQNVLPGVEDAMGKLEQALRDALGEGNDDQASREDPASTPESSDEAREENPLLQQLQDRLASVREGIGQVSGQAVDRLTRQADYLADRLAKEFLDGVEDAMAALEGALRDVLPDGADAPAQTRAEPSPTEPGPDPEHPAADDGAELTALVNRLKEVSALIATLPAEAQSRVRAAFDAVVKMAKSRDVPGAREGLGKIEAVLERFGVASAPAEATETETETETAANGAQAPAEVYTASSAKWRQTRTNLEGEIGKLEEAIKAACQGDDELWEVMANTKTLFGYIHALDGRLDAKLDQIAGADPAALDGLKGEARQLLEEYKAELAKPFFADVDAGNGFVNVNVAAGARSALADIEQVLAA